MSLFDKLKSEAAGAARRTSGSVSQQISGAASGILGHAEGKSWRVAFEDIPTSLSQLRALPEARGRLIVTPGVRPTGSDAGDQKRIETPATAIAAGADHIVVGRPIWQATDPEAAARAILAELPARA